MDDIVRQAMAKWPNVPHCFAWLALDARGNWRMRDERAQSLGLPGDSIRNPALLAFINRNYLHDAHGGWYFQNGPQRVYVDLELAPLVCRTDPGQGMVLHTGNPMPMPREALLSVEGDLVFGLEQGCAVLDDRDLADCLSLLSIDGKPVDEEALAAWMAGAPAVGWELQWQGQRFALQRLKRDELPQRFGFTRLPRAAA